MPKRHVLLLLTFHLGDVKTILEGIFIPDTGKPACASIVDWKRLHDAISYGAIMISLPHNVFRCIQNLDIKPFKASSAAISAILDDYAVDVIDATSRR